jgi:hypothetical protein
MKPNRKFVIKWMAGLAITGIFAAWVEYALGWRTVLAPLANIAPDALLVGLAGLFASYGLRAWRMQVHFALSGHFMPLLRLTLIHNTLNNLLPARTGEAAFPWLMGRYFGTSLHESIGGLAWLRLLDLAMLCALAALWALPVPGPLAVVLAIACLFSPSLAVHLLHIAATRGAGKHAAFDWLGKMTITLPRDRRRVIYAWLLTAINWFAKLIVLSWFIRALVPLDFTTASAGVVGGEITSVLPVHGVAGLGSYEAGVAVALMPSGTAGSLALQAAVALHALLLLSSITSALLALFLPLPQSKIDNTP